MQLKTILEGALLAAGRALPVAEMQDLFDLDQRPEAAEVRRALAELSADCENRGYEVREVASGFRLQVKQALSPWMVRLWEEKPARYSRALLETLALIAYRQPITRGDIEEIRGVAVNPNIIRTLQEREWVRVVGQRDVPGRPELLATTRKFLDHFGLKSLEDLPTLSEIKDFEEVTPELQLDIDGPIQASARVPDAADAAGEDDPDEIAVAEIDEVGALADSAAVDDPDQIEAKTSETEVADHDREQAPQ